MKGKFLQGTKRPRIDHARGQGRRAGSRTPRGPTKGNRPPLPEATVPIPDPAAPHRSPELEQPGQDPSH